MTWRQKVDVTLHLSLPASFGLHHDNRASRLQRVKTGGPSNTRIETALAPKAEIRSFVHHFREVPKPVVSSCSKASRRSLRLVRAGTVVERADLHVTVRFLRRHEDGRSQAPSFGGVAETFDARNRGARVRAMDI